jgi:hypothetical protein
MLERAPHTEIVADTDQYSGNFEREISAWVFGVLDTVDDDSEYLVEDPALYWARENPETYELGALETTLTEYGDSWQLLALTPGWRNDGGEHTRLLAEEDPERVAGAYQSVRWVFGRSLSDGEIASVRSRVFSFAAEWTRRMEDSNRADAVLRVEGVRVFEVVETRVETLRT